MPLTTPAPAQIANAFRIDAWSVNHRVVGKDSITIYISSGITDSQGQVSGWNPFKNYILEGTSLLTALANVTMKIQTKLTAGSSPEVAAYQAIKESLYEALQLAKIIPSGSLT